MSDRDEAINDGAHALQALLSTLEMLCECQGNKAKLEFMEVIIDQFLELQELCEMHRFTLAVGVDIDQDQMIHA